MGMKAHKNKKQHPHYKKRTQPGNRNRRIDRNEEESKDGG